ncbi:MAG: elongation factor P [Deltaproteobacteria bacterium]|nr:MAG: elongation factor P [Deltaproteobacteria bacterium]
MLSTTDFRKNLKLMIDGQPCVIIDFQHVKPGKGGAFVRTKWRNLITGNVQERNFRSGEKFEKPDLEEKTMEYLYNEGDKYYFMDTSTYEQTFVTKDTLGNAVNFLKENIQADILFFEGKVIGVDLPNTVELKVVKCDPAVKGDTVTGATKPATLETGYTVNVPLFINEGDVLKIDTRTGEYLERVG